MTRSGTDRPSAAVPGTELTHGWVRLARAGVLGGMSLLLATAGHVVGGGTLPGAGLLALIGVALALLAISLTARRIRFAALFVVLSIEQLLLHVLFHAAATGATCAAVAMPGHPMATGSVCGTAPAAATTGWAMLLGHVLAVLATAWLLARGERWLWRTAERLHAYATARPRHRRRTRPQAVPHPLTHPRRTCWVPAGPRAPPVV